MNTLQAALHWYEQGVTPLPCLPRSKSPAVPWSVWQQHTPPKRLVVHWFKQSHNLALLTGSGDLLVLDFDTLPVYYEWRMQFPEAAESYTVKSRRGRHVYFRCDKEISTFSVPGLDVLGSRHIVIAPPSVHPSGIQYEICQHAPLLKVDSVSDIVNMPEIEEKAKASFVAPPARHYPGDSLIARVKSRLSLLDLLSWYTTPLSNGKSRWYIMRCPNPTHQDRSPSFWADANADICSCFKPACEATQPSGLPMDIFNVYAWIHNISNTQAVHELAKEVGIK